MLIKLSKGAIQFKVKVPSKSKKGTYHIVIGYTNGEMDCDCVASNYGADECSHKQKAADWYFNKNK